jgi:hypothetical protein
MRKMRNEMGFHQYDPALVTYANFKGTPTEAMRVHHFQTYLLFF